MIMIELLNLIKDLSIHFHRGIHGLVVKFCHANGLDSVPNRPRGAEIFCNPFAI